MRQAQINVRTRACSRTSIARTKQAALTHNVRGKELISVWKILKKIFHVFSHEMAAILDFMILSKEHITSKLLFQMQTKFAHT